jgi:hypothetical protein
VAFIFLPERDSRREQVSEFKTGDKVKYRGMVMPGEILSGPHRAPAGTRYLVRKADGNVTLAYVTHLERIIPRIDQVAERLAVGVYARQFGSLDIRTQMRLVQVARAAIEIADETRGQ